MFFSVQDNEGSICAEVVHVGQLVPCMVLRVDDDKKEGKVNKRVWLSLRLSRMYKGLSLDAIQDGMVFISTLFFLAEFALVLDMHDSSLTLRTEQHESFNIFLILINFSFYVQYHGPTTVPVADCRCTTVA